MNHIILSSIIYILISYSILQCGIKKIAKIFHGNFMVESQQSKWGVGLSVTY